MLGNLVFKFSTPSYKRDYEASHSEIDNHKKQTFCDIKKIIVRICRLVFKIKSSLIDVLFISFVIKYNFKIYGDLICFVQFLSNYDQQHGFC